MCEGKSEGKDIAIDLLKSIFSLFKFRWLARYQLKASASFLFIHFALVFRIKRNARDTTVG